MRKNRSDNRQTSGKSRLVMLLALAALMCLLVMPAAAYADSYPAQPTDWTVTFDGESLTSNFDASAIQKELQGMQPGDEATLTFTLVNGHSEAVDWWMENEIIKSLEDQSKVLRPRAAARRYCTRATRSAASRRRCPACTRRRTL